MMTNHTDRDALVKRLHFIAGLLASEDDAKDVRDAIAHITAPAEEPVADPVAWVEVKDSYEGPYEFHGQQLLPVGKHSLYIAPRQQDARSVRAGSTCAICGCVAPHAHNEPDEKGHYHWYAVDLDGTLTLDAHPKNPLIVGEPNSRVVEAVKSLIRDGFEVRIFTARVSKGKDARDIYAVTMAVQDWCQKHIGHRLPVTNIKGHGIIELWDDRAVNPIRVNKDVDGLLTLLAKEKRLHETVREADVCRWPSCDCIESLRGRECKARTAINAPDFEGALAELVGKLCPDIDSGDLIADAKTASDHLDRLDFEASPDMCNAGAYALEKSGIEVAHDFLAVAAKDCYEAMQESRNAQIRYLAAHPAEPLIACHCFNDRDRELCLDKNKCRGVNAAAAEPAGKGE